MVGILLLAAKEHLRHLSVLLLLIDSKANIPIFHASQYTFSTNGLVLEIFDNFSILNFWPWILIQQPKFSLIPNFHIPRVCDLDFMAIITLRIYEGFDRQNRSGRNFTPSVNFHGQIPYKFSNLLFS